MVLKLLRATDRLLRRINNTLLSATEKLLRTERHSRADAAFDACNKPSAGCTCPTSRRNVLAAQSSALIPSSGTLSSPDFLILTIFEGLSPAPLGTASTASTTE